jgi:tRNA pseudouridine55 synthase
MDAVEGLILLDKPAGISSRRALSIVRRALGGAKAGHAGTLDPFATGLLLILLGRATKIQQQLIRLPKRYETTAQLGATSSTGDPEGEITHTGRIPQAGTELPMGEIRQRPPIYSAVKIGGERAYKRARRGENFQMPERIVDVYGFYERWREGERAGYEIECSAGTYVRSLISELSDAYCLQLRRTAIGPFHVRDALSLPERGEPIDVPEPIPIAEALELANSAGPPSH